MRCDSCGFKQGIMVDLLTSTSMSVIVAISLLKFMKKKRLHKESVSNIISLLKKQIGIK